VVIKLAHRAPNQKGTAMKTPSVKHAFTLIELLVVIVVLGVLMSLLLPTLSKAKLTSKRTRSISNQKQISVAYGSYLHDNRGRYPQVWGFAAVGGKLGNLTNNFKMPANAPPGLDIHKVARFYGTTTPPDDRPLNEYVNQNYEVFRDPMDIGGTSLNVESCFDAFGNSYQPQVADDMFRVKRVLGDLKEAPGSYEHTSLLESDLVNPANKIVQGDWNWPYDRGDTWHAERGEPGHVILYADSHAAYFVFPPTKTMMNEWWINPKNLIVKDGNGIPQRNGRGEYIYNNALFRAKTGQAYDYIDPAFTWW
jgi:prepilin-type N-terminal cleavage/methylation domain-containing protein